MMYPGMFARFGGPPIQGPIAVAPHPIFGGGMNYMMPPALAHPVFGAQPPVYGGQPPMFGPMPVRGGPAFPVAPSQGAYGNLSALSGMRRPVTPQY